MYLCDVFVSECCATMSSRSVYLYAYNATQEPTLECLSDLSTVISVYTHVVSQASRQPTTVSVRRGTRLTRYNGVPVQSTVPRGPPVFSRQSLSLISSPSGSRGRTAQEHPAARSAPCARAACMCRSIGEFQYNRQLTLAGTVMQ